MKMVQPTLESFLKETNRVYLRMEYNDQGKAIVAGGFRRDGVWTEFHSQVDKHSSNVQLMQHVKVMALIVEEHKKSWTLYRVLNKGNQRHTFQVSRIRLRNEDLPFTALNLGLN